jgi:mercuric ion binding protein
MIINTMVVLLSTSVSMVAWAACTHYEMRVDGLACPYCAYGIEKKLAAIDGVQNLDIDLENGLVSVDVSDGVVLTEADLKQLFDDAGFTFRSMNTTPLNHNPASVQK